VKTFRFINGTVRFTGAGEAWSGIKDQTEDCEDVIIQWDPDDSEAER
jgi:hypothetical protein